MDVVNKGEVDNTNNNDGTGEGNYYQNPVYPDLPPTVPLDWWKFEMRRSMQEIVPGLFLGPYASASKASLEKMQTAGLTHVICIRQAQEKKFIRPNHLNHFRYLVLEVAGTQFPNIISHFNSMNCFLDECQRSGGIALIHGNNGMCRSASFTIARLMWKFGKSFEQTYRYVLTKRGCINLNEGFQAQLLEYEAIVRAHHTVPLVILEPNNAERGAKRSNDETDHQPMDIE